MLKYVYYKSILGLLLMKMNLRFSQVLKDILGRGNGKYGFRTLLIVVI